jgi:WD40 repeat protein
MGHRHRPDHPRKLTGHTASVLGVAFSPDGKLLATTSSDTTARLSDTATGQTIYALNGHADGVRAVAFSPDGKRLATTSENNTRLWAVR